MTKGNVLLVLKTNARHCYEEFIYHLGGQDANVLEALPSKSRWKWTRRDSTRPWNIGFTNITNGFTGILFFILIIILRQKKPQYVFPSNLFRIHLIFSTWKWIFFGPSWECVFSVGPNSLKLEMVHHHIFTVVVVDH